MALDIARLRRQQFDQPEIPDLSGGTMDLSGVDFGPPPSSSPYEVDPYEQEQPIYNQQPAMDPRQPVNPTIAPPVGGPGSTGDDAMQRTIDAINRIYRPQYTSRNRYNNLLDSFPERESPGFARALTAASMSMGAKDPMDALNVQERVMYAPHARDMADWTARTGPYGNAAQYENTANINERTLAGNVVTAQTQADRLAESARQADQKNEVAIERNRLTAVKNALGRGWVFNGRGPTVIAQNTTTGESKDTGITTGWMTEADKIAAESAGDLAVQQSRNQGALDTQGSRNAGQLAVQTLRNQRITGNGSTKGLLPSQQKDALYNKAEQWIRQHPEDQANITLNPAQRDFDVEEPGTTMFGRQRGMSPENYDAFINELYGSGGGMAPSGIPQPPAAPTMPRGGGSVQPGQQGPPQGNLDLSMPANIDPHGRQPQAQRDAILRANPDLAQELAQGQQAPAGQPRGNISLTPQAQQPISAPPPQQSTSPTMWSDLASKITSPSTWQSDPNVQRQQRMQQIQQSLQQASSAVDELFNVKQSQVNNPSLQQELDRLISAKEMEMNQLQDEYERLKSTGQAPYVAPTPGQSYAPAPVAAPPQAPRPYLSIAQMEAENNQIGAPPQQAAPQQALPPAPAGRVWVQLPGAKEPGLVPIEVARQRGLKPLQ